MKTSATTSTASPPLLLLLRSQETHVELEIGNKMPIKGSRLAF